MVPPRRRRRPGSRAAVGVCAGGRGLGVGGFGSCAPGPPLLSRPLPPSPRPGAPPRSGSRSPHSARRPAGPPARSLAPPGLAHKQDGGCCFFPPPNPPDGLAVAAAAGNEPRGGGGAGGEKGRGRPSGGGAGRGLGARGSHNGGEGRGRGQPRAGSAQARPRQGASANSPRSLSLAPFKGEVAKGAGDGLGIYFQSVDTDGEGPRVGSPRIEDRRKRATESGETPVPGQVAEKGMAPRPGPWAGRPFEPRLNPSIRGTLLPGVPGQRPNVSSPLHRFPKTNGLLPPNHTDCELFTFSLNFTVFF